MPDPEKHWTWGVVGNGWEGGRIWIDEKGLTFDVDDDYYSGTLSRDDAVALAKSILARFTGATFKGEP